MEKRFLDLVSRLLLNSKSSDRDIAKKIKASQPTVGRMRRKLEDEKIISEYTVIPDLSKLDIELISLIAVKWSDYKKTRELKKFESFIQKNDLVFFSAPGEGFQDKTKLIISLHRDYKSYELFLRGLRANFADVVGEMETFLVSTDNIIKNFTYQGLANTLRKQK
ncbi:MAG: hypothetical protein GF334_07400 [Candidatus Altiarchaeales archaeon]|nr:hypothetical protein [Candidatus Altiarchaeales archaeon]